MATATTTPMMTAVSTPPEPEGRVGGREAVSTPPEPRGEEEEEKRVTSIRLATDCYMYCLKYRIF